MIHEPVAVLFLKLPEVFTVPVEIVAKPGADLPATLAHFVNDWSVAVHNHSSQD